MTESYSGILVALQTALSESFQEKLSEVSSPYGAGNASIRIKDCLKSISLADLVSKVFHDLD